jgi:serine/threonine-protein kinase
MGRLLTPGDRLRDYEVIAPLPSGGMAMLYLARRRGVGGFSQQVALKLVHPQLVADPSMLELFLDEARLAAQVVHPNVVRVHEVGMERGNYFIAMEYVDGASLAEFLQGLRGKRLRLRRKLCVWLTTQVAEALHATHEAKGENGAPLDIVHRDVSPQNVLIGHSGHVKLIDFGIASSRTSCNPLETGPFMLGKLRYAAPERLKLEPTDRRADVYALGVMLWEMLTARSFLRCHHVEDPDDWAVRENPPPPSKYAPHIPSLLDAVVLKAIHPDPQLRYPDALRFRRALLRADPSAARVDAARIAALMELAMGDELDRRHAATVLQNNSFIEELVGGAEAKPGPGAERPVQAKPKARLPARVRAVATQLATPGVRAPAQASTASASARGARHQRALRRQRKALYSALVCLLTGVLIGASTLGLETSSTGAPARAEMKLVPSVASSMKRVPEHSEPRNAVARAETGAKSTASIGRKRIPDQADRNHANVSRPMVAHRSVAARGTGAGLSAKLRTSDRSRGAMRQPEKKSRRAPPARSAK